jgi:hypothetical protein
MTWTDIKQLEKSLTEETLSEKDVFYYLLTSSLITAIVPYLSDSKSDNKVLAFIELLFGVVFTIVLLRATFNINNIGDKRDYLKRFISLSLVSFIRLFLFALGPIILTTIILKVIDSMDLIKYDDIRQVYIFSLTIFMSIAYYVMLTNSFKRVNQRN